MADILRSCIQEWFAQVRNAVDVATTYYEVRNEAEAQLRFMMDEIKEKDNG